MEKKIMKKFIKLLFLFLFTFVMNAFLYAQNNVQQDLENMYRERESYDRVQDSLAEVERVRDSIIQAQMEQQRAIMEQQRAMMERRKEFFRQRAWEHITGNDKNGPVMGPVRSSVGLDRQRVKQALEDIVDLDAILDSVSVSQYYNAIKYFSEPVYVAEILNARFLGGKYNHIMYQNGEPIVLKGIDVMKIYQGPVLLVLTNSNNWVLVDSQYKVHNSIDINGVMSYPSIAEERRNALAELGFSEETIRKYATDNPWNLIAFVACDNFDGHDLVEKVAVAWRYSSIANNKEERRETPNHKKQYRFVYIKRDGEEKEEAPKKAQDLPRCLDLNKRERNPFYESNTQPIPPNYGKQVGRERESGSCGGIRYSEEGSYLPDNETLIKPDEQWFF